MSVTPEPAPLSPPAPTWYDSPQWQAAWAQTTVEHRYHSEQFEVSRHGRPQTLSHHVVASSPFWSGYETDAGVPPVFDGPIVTLPSLYSVFGPSHLVVSRSAVSEVVERALGDAHRWNAQALLVTNLTAPAADRWAQILPPVARVRLDIAYFADVSGGIDTVLPAVPRHKRTDWRRRWRRATERGVRLVDLPGPQATAWLPEMLRLSNASAVKHGIAPLYDLTSLQHLARLPQARLFLAEYESRPLAAFLAFEHQGVLHLWAGGIDYTRLAEFSPYLFLLYELIALAPARGWRRLEFGRGNYEFKRQYGFTGVELWTLCYPAAPDAGARLARRLGDLHQQLSRFMGISSSEDHNDRRPEGLSTGP